MSKAEIIVSTNSRYVRFVFPTETSRQLFFEKAGHRKIDEICQKFINDMDNFELTGINFLRDIDERGKNV